MAGDWRENPAFIPFPGEVPGGCFAGHQNVTRTHGISLESPLQASGCCFIQNFCSFSMDQLLDVHRNSAPDFSVWFCKNRRTTFTGRCFPGGISGILTSTEAKILHEGSWQHGRDASMKNFHEIKGKELDSPRSGEKIGFGKAQPEF